MVLRYHYPKGKIPTIRNIINNDGGLCYERSWDYFYNNVGRYTESETDLLLVIGIGSNELIENWKHCWCEVGELVIDVGSWPQTYVVIEPRERYYKLRNIIEDSVRRYDWEQAWTMKENHGWQSKWFEVEENE